MLDLLTLASRPGARRSLTTGPPGVCRGLGRAPGSAATRESLAALALAVCSGTATGLDQMAAAPPSLAQASSAPAVAPAPASVVPTGTPDALLPGSIVAFVPRASGFMGSAAELPAWLAARGWAICDGTNGTPDLRDRMLLGTTDATRVGERLGSRDHDHRVRGDTGAPVLRNRYTRTGLAELKNLPDDQHRHAVDLASDRAEHLPLSTRVLFIMKLP